MRCPFCFELEDKVIDSRLAKDGYSIRRRRECLGCLKRFTTYEKIEQIPLMIVKKDGRREEFSRDKLRTGILRACEKRNISIDTIEQFIDEFEMELNEKDSREIPVEDIGEKVMEKLHELDEVAYVRFASVYREFKDVNDFVNELRQFLMPEKRG
ncbi:MAG: transcriptional regulator NrdR [Deltaproteobacteria bacterium]|nr:MAG: transcriptional regulator NrdR [Deltaproteobacteria bacterium]